MPTVAATRRGLRDRPLGKVAILIAILSAAFLVSRSCGSSGTAVSQDEAQAIAREAIDYEPDRVLVRYLQRGVRPRSFWAVSLQTLDAAGEIDRLTVVVVDAQTGEIDEIRVREE